MKCLTKGENMENQHQKIKTYRDLSEQEIELMNELKVLESQVLDKLEEIGAMRQAQKDYLTSPETFGNKVEGLKMKQLHESHRCIDLAKTNVQQGFMWGVRSVALPDPVVTAND